jgi:antitoxin (DNA-binding transcriptional repressor) of toxin-antitoxin stability system
MIDMEALSVRDYRKNLAASFDRADNGETIIIRRKNQLYALVSVGREELTITSELQSRIDEAEKACREGKCVTCKTKEDIINYLDSL